MDQEAVCIRAVVGVASDRGTPIDYDDWNTSFRQLTSVNRARKARANYQNRFHGTVRFTDVRVEFANAPCMGTIDQASTSACMKPRKISVETE